MTLGLTLQYNLNSWIPGLIAAWHLHAPAHELVSVRFRVYQAAVKEISDFKWTDLLKSAPALLQSKVTTSALRDLNEITEEQRTAA